jgi:thiol-disulfide isomerase/thioredoxin
MSKAKRNKSKAKGISKFDENIRDLERAFVLFYATWCPFSQRFLPIFEEYSKSNPGECLRIIVDDEPDVCEEFAIEYYPTVIMFKKGKVQRRLDSEPGVGLNKKQLENLTKEC